jgi:SAM-dependent methyltransferase
VPAARTGAEVLGVDIATNLVEAGNRRAQAEGLTNLHFQEGDASNLEDLADDIFDVVISIFGAMFAPRPMDVAAEMVRVTKPGGKIVMGNWIPHDPTLVAQLLKISGEYSPPPPPGFISPVTWGVADNVIERFGAAGVPAERIRCEPRTYTFISPNSPLEFLADFRKYYGPTINAFAAADADGLADILQGELEMLFNAQNRDPDPGATLIDAKYLRVEVRVGPKPVRRA